MDSNRRSHPGHWMADHFHVRRTRRLSRTAAVGALLAVAVLAAVAAGLIGGGTLALAHRGLDATTDSSPTVLRAWAGQPMEVAPMPQVPADAEEAQPMATF